MKRDLEITGRLELSLDDAHSIDVTAHGSRVRAEIGDLAPKRLGLHFIRSTATLAGRLSRILHARTLTLTITRDGVPFAELGTGVRSYPLARLFGLSRVRVYWKR